RVVLGDAGGNASDAPGAGVQVDGHGPPAVRLTRLLPAGDLLGVVGVEVERNDPLVVLAVLLVLLLAVAVVVPLVAVRVRVGPAALAVEPLPLLLRSGGQRPQVLVLGGRHRRDLGEVVVL